MARDYTKWEHRLVAEWAAASFPGLEVRFRTRLGALDTQLSDPTISQEELRGLGVWRRYVDALIIGEAELHLVEGKIRGAPGALEQLDLYARLVPLTPELRAWRDWPITRHLVWAIPDPVIRAMALEREIRVHFFRPPWVEDYLAQLRPNERSATQPRGLRTEPRGAESGQNERAGPDAESGLPGE